MGTCEEPVKLCKTGLCITSSSQSSVELTLGSHAVFFGHSHQYVLEQSVHQSFASCLHQILDSPHPLFEMCLVSNTFRRFALNFKRSFLQFRANLYTFAMGFLFLLDPPSDFCREPEPRARYSTQDAHPVLVWNVQGIINRVSPVFACFSGNCCFVLSF